MKIKKPFLIAEIGINHNGSVDIAKKLILNAKNAGFDSVKFQKRTIDLVYSKEILVVNIRCNSKVEQLEEKVIMVSKMS